MTEESNERIVPFYLMHEGERVPIGEVKQVKNSRGKWRDVEVVITNLIDDGDDYRVNLIRPKTYDYKQAIISQGFNIELNVMTGRPESHRKPLDDITEAKIINVVRDIGLNHESHVRRAILELSGDNEYHPVREWFGECEWDGTDRFSQLIDYLEFENKEAGRVFLRRWMIGAVAKVYEQGQNFMLVLDGEQGIGKSYFSRWLCPIPHMFVEGAIRAEDKDSLSRLVKYFIWEVAEFEGIVRRADIAALKDFITKPEVTWRQPYARHEVTKSANASLIGTINGTGAGFLRDTTGNRRFGIVKIDGINHAYTEIDKSQLWAQMCHAYRTGEAWQLSKEEKQMQNEINTSYEVVSMTDDLLQQHFEIDPTQKDWFMTTAQILIALESYGLKGSQRSLSMELADLLKKMRLAKVRRGGKWGWCGVKDKFNEK